MPVCLTPVIIFSAHFSDPGKAISLVCVCVFGPQLMNQMNWFKIAVQTV